MARATFSRDHYLDRHRPVNWERVLVLVGCSREKDTWGMPRHCHFQVSPQLVCPWEPDQTPEWVAYEHRSQSQCQVQVW